MKTKIVKMTTDWLPYEKEDMGQSILFIYEKVEGMFPYWLKCFKCGLIAHLGLHEVKVEEDLINISPSILCPKQECGNHYYIRNSEIVNA